MSDSNYIKDCAFSEQAVSYAYGEIGGREKSVFEKHLRTCSICADDVGGFDSTRSAVSYWVKEEFKPLATPRTEFTTGAASTKPQNPPVENKSWLAGLKDIFMFSPVLYAGLALILFFGGWMLLIQSPMREKMTAERLNKKTESPADSKQTDGKIVAQNQASDSGQSVNNAANFANNAGREIDSTVTNKDLRIEKTLPVTIAKNISAAGENASGTANRKVRLAVADKPSNTNLRVSRRPSTGKKQTLQLNNIEEDEESATLRLTDLLDAVGGK